MPYYGREGHHPLYSADWEKVWAIKWSPSWESVILKFLKQVQENGSVPDEHFMMNGGWQSMYYVSGRINNHFRQAGLPYRFFKTQYGGRAFTVGIVAPIKRNTRRLKKATLKVRAMRDLTTAAHAVGKRVTPARLAQLRKALKNPNLSK